MSACALADNGITGTGGTGEGAGAMSCPDDKEEQLRNRRGGEDGEDGDNKDLDDLLGFGVIVGVMETVAAIAIRSGSVAKGINALILINSTTATQGGLSNAG